MQINYQPGDGFIYSINPMIKGATVFFAILFFSLNGFSAPVIFFSLIFLILFSMLLRIPLYEIFWSMKRIIVLLLVVGLVQGFRNGTFEWVSAFEAVLRIVGVFLSAGIYVTISSQSELSYFWETCFRPFTLIGLPARELALVMVIAVRFMPVILGEIERIKMAQQARGAELGGKGILSSATALMPLLIPTLTQAIMRANDLALAMEARGYCTSKERTRYNRYRFSIIDFFAALGPLILGLSVVFSRLP